MKTKFLSLFLSLIMVLSCFAAALPAFAEGEAAGGENVDYDALAVAKGYVARVGTPEKAYAEGAFTGYYKSFASVQTGYTPGTGEYANAYDAAVAALQNAEATAEDKTVYMLADVEISNTFKLGAGITVDGMGHYISGIFHQKVVEFNSTTEATIKNWTVWQRGQHGPVQVSATGAVARIENCYILGTGVTTAGIIVNAKNQTVTIKDTTIRIIDTANVTGLGMTSDTGVRVYYDNQTVTMENCVIDCSENFGSSGMHLYNNDAKGVTPAHNKVVLTNCIVTAQGAALYIKDVDVTINGGSYTTLYGASAMTAVKVPVYETNEDGSVKVDAEGNPIQKVDAEGNPVTADKREHVAGEKPSETTAGGVVIREYTEFEYPAIRKGRGGQLTLTGTIKMQGGTAALFYDTDDMGAGTTPAEGVVHTVTTNLNYDADKDYYIWRDAADTAAFEAGAVCYTFNDDGSKTYYKNLTPKDKDIAEGEEDAVTKAAGKTIYLISDIQLKDDKNNASDQALPNGTVINGMGYTINMRGYFCIDQAGKTATISNATITTLNPNRVLLQANPGATLYLNNVDLISYADQSVGFVVVRGNVYFDDVTWKFDIKDAEGNAVAPTGKYLFHTDGANSVFNIANCRVDSTTNAPNAALFLKGMAGSTFNITGNSDIAFAKYGFSAAGGAGTTVTVEDYAVVRSLDNTFVMQDADDVINVNDNATIISDTKNAIKLVGKGSVANINDNAVVKGGREIVHAYGEGSSIVIGANVTVSMIEGEKNAATIYLQGKDSTLISGGNLDAVAGKPVIKIEGAGANATVKSGTVKGYITVGTAENAASFTLFGGVIDAGAATTEAIVVAAGSTANTYEGIVKGGTAPKTGDTYAEGTTEKAYTELSAKVPTFGAISLRMNADSEGMRFTSTVSKEVNEYAQSLVAAGIVADYNYGTFVVRQTELNSAEFTIEDFNDKKIRSAIIIADEGLVVNSDGSLTYSAAVTNFQAKNYGVTLVARAFIAYTLTDGSVKYVYSEEPGEDDGLNLADLAKEALGDVKMAMEDGYKNKVSSYYEKDAKGKWKAKKGTAYAPYSKAQQELLNLYIEEA